MCNLYKARTTVAEMNALFRSVTLPNLPQFADIYPNRDAPVVRAVDGTRAIEVMRWGFPPPMAAARPVTNVRNLASPFWRTALTRPDRRCLVPVTSFCEWEGEAGSKRKVWFEVIGAPLFAFAGIWRPTDEGPRFAFLTTEPNAIVGAVHPKAMPVMLSNEADFETWLTADLASAVTLARAFPDEQMRVAA